MTRGTGTSFPLGAIRALVLHAQGLATPLGAEPQPTSDAIYDAVKQVGCLQIDAIHVVHRSHYLVLWSRLGHYDPVDLDRLIYGRPDAEGEPNPRRLFEGWLHEASIIPLDEYRYQLPHMRRIRATPARMSRQWLSEPDTAETLRQVLERIRREGALRVSDLPYNGPKRDGWFGWKPTKNALVHLGAWGDLIVADRAGNFQLVYDLRERILPDWVDTTEPTQDEMIRHLLECAVRSFGACRPERASDYASETKAAMARAYIERMLAEDLFVEIQADLGGSITRKLIVHRDNLPLLERAADGALTARRTTFLSPFDSLFWPKGRDEILWGFRKALEAYKPKTKRRWGYYCLPILHRDRLVGRFDPKLERQTGTIQLRSLYLEPGVEPDASLVCDVAAAMRDFMAFHEVSDLTIERSEPAQFGAALLSAI